MDDTVNLPRPLVTTDWLENALGASDLRILDCSIVMRATDEGGYTFAPGLEEWQASHIPGSAFVDIQNDLSHPMASAPLMLPPAKDFGAVMARAGVGTGTRTVLYDRSNHAWAARVWWMLRAYGYDAVAVLDGGWTKWTAEGRPASNEVPAHPQATFDAILQPDLVADQQRVQAASNDGVKTLINALSPEEHSGATCRFPRRGRIPGSVNVYCQSLIDATTNSYLPPAELRARFEAAGVSVDAPSITYCGAGIAASSDALALAVLGNDQVAVYDGSLSEWTSDPDLPLEVD